jgi:hypothetical protein
MQSRRALHYRGAMKKITRKLVVRSETVRTLDNTDLLRARGGGDPAPAAGTNRTESGMDCVVQAAVVVPK